MLTILHLYLRPSWRPPTWRLSRCHHRARRSIPLHCPISSVLPPLSHLSLSPHCLRAPLSLISLSLQAGHSKLVQVPGSNQMLVTGNGGPSGSGKRPLGEPVLPAPVFIQDIVPVSGPAPPPIPLSH